MNRNRYWTGSRRKRSKRFFENTPIHDLHNIKIQEIKRLKKTFFQSVSQTQHNQYLNILIPEWRLKKHTNGRETRWNIANTHNKTKRDVHCHRAFRK